MQPFDPFRRGTSIRMTQTKGAGLGYGDSLNEAPRFEEVMREMGVIALSCLGVAVAAEILVHLLAMH